MLAMCQIYSIRLKSQRTVKDIEHQPMTRIQILERPSGAR